MGRESRLNEQKRQSSAIIVFPNDELKLQYLDFIKRTRALLESTAEFFDACVKLDEDAPDFQDKISAPLEKFTVDLILNYPNYGVFLTDLESLNNVIVR